MKINLSAFVENPSVNDAYSRFDRTLFLQLAPPLPRFELLRFDGCKTNDYVEIMLHTPFGKEKWVSRIVDDKITDELVYFIDEGIVLPSFLSRWKHKHIIKKHKNGVLVVDSIDFEASKKWMRPFVFLGVYLQIFYRNPIYKKKLKAKILE